MKSHGSSNCFPPIPRDLKTETSSGKTSGMGIPSGVDQPTFEEGDYLSCPHFSAVPVPERRSIDPIQKIDPGSVAAARLGMEPLCLAANHLCVAMFQERRNG